MNDVDTLLAQGKTKAILSLMLDRFGAADLVSALSDVIRNHRNVPNQISLADDLRKIAEEQPSISWRNP